MTKSNVTSFEAFSKSFVNNYFSNSNWNEQLTRDGYDRLRTYLGKVAKGQPNVYNAPFAKGQTMSKILADWKQTLVSIRDKWPSLWDFEIDLANKVGPMSVQLPVSERLTDVAHYYYDTHLSSQPILPEAINRVQDELRMLRGMRIRGISATVDKMKKSTNSGLPFFTKRRNVIQDTIPCVSKYSDWRHGPTVFGTLNNTDWELSAVIGWRGQEGGPTEEDVKQRVVWMFPMSVNINELQVYQPLIELCQKFNLVPAWVSMDSVDREITNLFDTKGSEDLVVCTDFTRFDQHFNKDMQDAAKSILKFLLSNEKSSQDWLENVYPIKYCIPLIWSMTDWGVTSFKGWHGMASGSGGTNADETLTHRTLQHEAAILNDSHLNPHSMCLGDDGVLTYPGITVDDVIAAYKSHGQECNNTKQYAATQDCVYLRRWHHSDYRLNGVCVGVYSTCRALGRLRYLERFMDPEYWSPQMVALRQLSILENCKWHPLKEQFVRFCMKRDKYRLGIDIPGFLSDITHIAEEAIDHMPDFLGYTKTLQGEGPSGISEWWIVQYLKSLR
nr:MAG: RNA-dependent RNA-polymerase [Picobirnavirus sp.]